MQRWSGPAGLASIPQPRGRRGGPTPAFEGGAGGPPQREVELAASPGARGLTYRRAHAIDRLPRARPSRATDRLARGGAAPDAAPRRARRGRAARGDAGGRAL